MPDRRKIARLALLAPALLATSLVAGCTQPTPYAPAVDGKGYKEQQLENDRYRVSFTGNSATPRETVTTAGPGSSTASTSSIRSSSAFCLSRHG